LGIISGFTGIFSYHVLCVLKNFSAYPDSGLKTDKRKKLVKSNLKVFGLQNIAQLFTFFLLYNPIQPSLSTEFSVFEIFGIRHTIQHKIPKLFIIGKTGKNLKAKLNTGCGDMMRMFKGNNKYSNPPPHLF